MNPEVKSAINQAILLPAPRSGSRIDAVDCAHRQLIPVSNTAIYQYLASEHTIGVFLLQENDFCYFLAVDFDRPMHLRSCNPAIRTWYANSPRDIKITPGRSYLDIFCVSRSSTGCPPSRYGYYQSYIQQLQLSYYDRLFPNQDIMPKGGFGNHIALPLLKGHRGLDRSILLITPSGLTLPLGLIPMNAHNIEPTILRDIPVDSIREAFQAIYTDDEDIVQTAVFQFVQHIEPELRPLIFGQPHTQQFFLTFDIDTQCQEHRFVDDAIVLPHFQDYTVKINNGVNSIQWSVLPFYNQLHHGISDL